GATVDGEVTRHDGGSDDAAGEIGMQPATCTPVMVSDGTSLPSESFDGVTSDTPTCAGAARALLYAVTVPPNARAHLRAVPVAGGAMWTPRLVLANGCGDGVCLASDVAGADDGGREVSWINQGLTPTTVTVAVSAVTAVAGARFRLDVSVAEVLNDRCETARPLRDGLVLTNQDANKSATLSRDTCRPVAASSLFYSVHLLGKQTMTLDLLSPIPPGRVSLFMGIRESCAAMTCRSLSVRPDGIRFTNEGNESKTFVLQISSAGTPEQRVFSFKTSLQLPPGEVIVTPPPALTTDERGGTGSFTVVLGSPPLAPVILPLRSSDLGEATVTAALAFDPDNWFVPQTVVVKGVNDQERDGKQPFTIHVDPAQSTDPRYAGQVDKDGPDVVGFNQDDEPHIVIEAPVVLFTSEGGAAARFTVALSDAPTHPVQIGVTSQDPSEGMATPPELRFDASNWNTPQTVTISGVDDTDRDGPVTHAVTLGTAVSVDPRFDGIVPGHPVVRNIDDEWQTVAKQDLSPGSSCEGNHLSPIAVDRAGIVYVIYTCSERRVSGLSASAGYATVSLDGGRTFAPRVRLGDMSGTNQLTAGAPGTAIAVIDHPDGATSRIVRTVDGGATWTWGATVPIQEETIVTTAVSGRRIALMEIDLGGDLRIWSSDDGGTTFTSHDHTSIAGWGLDFDDAGALWLLGMDGNMRKSLDGGATFDAGIPSAAKESLRSVRGKNRLL
ncbi:MAG TPA: sialidase family protein, partial [Polyangia bacterium]